jgi:hypothetical protein
VLDFARVNMDLEIGYKISVVKSERNGQLERHRSRWDDNIKTCLKELGCMWIGFMLLIIGSFWRDFVNTAMNRRVPRKVGNLFIS